MYLDSKGVSAISYFFNKRVSSYNCLPTTCFVDLHKDPFSNYIKVDISKDKLEIPLIALDYVYKSTKIIHPTGADIIYFPIYVNNYTVARTFSTVLYKSFRVGDATRMTKITTNKGEIYYGGKGILCDKDFNILLLNTIVLEKSEKGIHINGYKVYVGKEVFTKDTMVTKGIKNKVIPAILESYYLYISKRDHYFSIIDCTQDEPVPIEVADLDRFIERPTEPNPDIGKDDVINDFLYKNVDNLFL